MDTILLPITAGHGATSPAASGPSWKLGSIRDLSPGGVSEMGYGTKKGMSKALQYLSGIKHREQYHPYAGWAAAFMPALLDVLPEILFDGKRPVPFHEIPARTHGIIGRKLRRISPRQLGFLISVIPLYHQAGSVKGYIWRGSGLDPSGQAMFKIAQYGVLYSVTTDHGARTSLGLPVLGYVAITLVADTLMLANTLTNGHTRREILVGGGLGAGILLAAHAVSRYTPLGDWMRGIAHSAGDFLVALSSGKSPIPR